MKYYEVTFETIRASILHRWKFFLVFWAIFVALGVLCGVLFSRQAADPGQSSAVAFATCDFETVEKDDLSYYSNCYVHLSTQRKQLYDYIAPLRLDTTVTKDQEQTIFSLMEELDLYITESLTPISTALNQPDALYLPDHLYEKAREQYTLNLFNTKNNLLKAQTARQLLGEIGALTTTDESANKTYSALLSEAAKEASLLINQATYERDLLLLDQNQEQIRQDSRAMEQMLDNACDALNDLIDTCNETMETVAMENHLHISKTLSGDEVTTNISHTNRMATTKEAFTAFVVIFALVGLCAGGFFAICLECRKRELSPINTEQG